MTRFKKGGLALLVAAVVVACGGGGGSAGTTKTSTTVTTDTTSTTPVVANLLYDLSKSTLTNGGADTVTLTMTAVDSNNNPIAGVPVVVAVDSGIYTPSATSTSATGQASGAISIGGNKANRNITATITMGAKTAKAVIAVTGAQITVTPVPATVAPGASTRVDVKVVDANGAGVAGAVVQFAGTLGLSSTATTDAAGAASATLGAAPATVGTYTVDATALGVTNSRTVQVVSGAGSCIPDAVGPISSANLSIVPTTIAPNQSGSTVNKAGMRAKFIDAANQAVQNVRVRFDIMAPGLGSGEQVSSAGAVVYSDVNGDAIADYIAGTRSSPTNGVVVRACYGLTDASLAGGACPTSTTQTLTVASQPLSVTLGDNNLLTRGNNSLTYIKQFDIAVADSAGNAVTGAVISASVDLTSYLKAPTYNTSPKTVCANEDANRNGSIDGGAGPIGEDKNNNGTIEPRKADVVLSFLNGNTTGTNGRMAIQVEYPQNVATWLNYTVRVTTNVAGSEGTVTRSFLTTFIDGDQTNGSFLVPPYGAALDCTVPN
jgi:protocatechuate 3,4-dioxygenase beta subunit